jgi:hypothetical protein
MDNAIGNWDLGFLRLWKKIEDLSNVKKKLAACKVPQAA